MYVKYIKRLLDIICAIITLIIFCWLYFIIAVFVWIFLGKPVIFKQERPGKNEKIFTLYKFKSMLDIRDANGELLSDNDRLGSFGKFLRQTSCDELPSAINILKGELSVVGPRPLLIKYLPLYSGEQRRRHEVRPGLTGLAQVNGRNAISWEEKFEWDIKYIENMCFWLDLKIILMTVKKSFIKVEGITYKNEVTTSHFINIKEKKNA